MSFPITSSGFCFGPQIQSCGWGNQFGGSCNQMLGPNRGGLWGALTGGLVGSILGGNPITGLIGAGVGALIGNSMGNHNHGHYGNHHHPHHQHCGSYPPPCGHHFGGPQFGGYHQPGFQHGCHQGPQFGRHCPPSQCCQPCGPGGREGQLTQKGKGKPINYTTRGGYQVSINGHTIQVKDPSGKNVLKHWGDPHENLNGKHLKDWQGKQRTVVLGDGTKITMTADGPKGVTNTTSIYDGRQNVQINNKGNQIVHQSFNPYDTQFREMRQYDGETALFRTAPNGAGIYNNIYNEDANFNVSRLYQQIGQTGGYQNPGKVYDFYPGL